MSQFYAQNWQERYNKMGDEAEKVFEQAYPYRAERYGLNRCQIPLRQVPDFVKYTPDFLTSTHFVEVKGVGKDHTLKIKCKQLSWLTVWHDQVLPVDVFIWDSYKRRYTTITAPTLWEACHELGERSHFPEGPPAWFLDLDRVALTWSSIDT